MDLCNYVFLQMLKIFLLTGMHILFKLITFTRSMSPSKIDAQFEPTVTSDFSFKDDCISRFGKIERTY